MIILVGSMVTGKQTSRHDAREIAESSLLIHTHIRKEHGWAWSECLS